MSHVVADQSEIFDFLADPGTHGGPVRRIDTHGAVVFLAGENAWKVKRAVRFPFMDFSTLAKRKAACAAEVAINRPNAPDLYRGVVPIVRDGDGLRLGGAGEPVEWAVHMRRFDESRTLDRVATDGLGRDLLARLAAAVIASHERAPVRDGAAATDALARYVEENREAFAETPDLFPPDRAAALTRAAGDALSALRPLLLARGEAGFVRRCHGDLHLRNIVLLDGEPVLFDAIEFDDAIATGDVLYDLAFLLMDLWERDLRAEANLLLNRYLWGTDEAHLQGLAALPLFLSLRAAIRAKVTAAALPHLTGEARGKAAAEARRYFAFAETFLAPAPAFLLTVGGLSGTGKSTLAAALTPRLGRPPGAVHLRSDVERKRLFGVPETERLPADAYDPAVTREVYARLQRQATLAVSAGSAVVVDAVHARPDERAAIEAVARDAGCAFAGLWLEAPAAVLTKRVEARRGDASDAGAAVVAQQVGYDVGPVGWRRLDASIGTEALTGAALAALGESGIAVGEEGT